MKSPLAVTVSKDERVNVGGSAYPATCFERDVVPLRPELVRAAMRMTGRVPDAEDLVQDAFLRAWRSYATFQPGTNVRAWMHQILRNTWINNYRAAQRRLTEVMVEDFVDQPADRGAPPADVTVLAGQPDQRVRAAMVGLRDEFRMVVYLADVEGYPYADIADMMGTPVGTVMSRLHRARRQLRAALGGTGEVGRLAMAA